MMTQTSAVILHFERATSSVVVALLDPKHRLEGTTMCKCREKWIYVQVC